MKILGFGNAIIDSLHDNIDDSFFAYHSLKKGSMSLISEDKALQFLNLKPAKICGGGSVANTISTIGALDPNNKNYKFFGIVGSDKMGNTFIDDCKSSNVEFVGIANAANHTSTSFVFISKDAERTMCTFLSNNFYLKEDDINEDLIKGNNLIYLEGYLWDNNLNIIALNKVIRLAKKNNIIIAITLSDQFCVERNHDIFIRLLDNIDILFANESEITSLAKQKNFDISLISKLLSNNTRLISVITRSEKGCIILPNKNSADNSIVEIPAFYVKNPIDSTGSGDSFAAGFLLGIAKGIKLNEAAEFANFIASKIVQKIGGRFCKEEILLYQDLLFRLQNK